jgi:hypothetical protein
MGVFRFQLLFPKMSRLLNVTGPSEPRLLFLSGVQSSVRGVEERSDAIGILRISGNSYADRKCRLLGVS